MTAELEGKELAQHLARRIEAREATIAVLGLGYVGLPLAVRCAEAGFSVIGFDVDPEKPRRLKAGESYLTDVAGDVIAALTPRRFRATSDPADLAQADAFLICVPTPLGLHREPDLSFVEATADMIASVARPGTLVSLESTSFPGTTEEIVAPRLVAAGLEPGRDVFLAYSPERENPGGRLDARRIPKIVAGSTAVCSEVAEALYGAVVERVVPMSSTRAAEMTKLLENIHRAVNIGLVNELKLVADRMGLDIHEIVDAAATKPFGFTPFRPGPGLGGHCIPIDPFYLTWKAREYGVETRFIELAGEVNSAMPAHVVGKVALALNDRGKAVKGSRVLVLGIAYKPNVNDSRETPAAEILRRLAQLGADIGYSDPHVPTFPVMRRFDFDLVSVDLSPEQLSGMDCAVLVTDHDAFDYDMIATHASLVVDTRGRLRGCGANIVQA